MSPEPAVCRIVCRPLGEAVPAALSCYCRVLHLQLKPSPPRISTDIRAVKLTDGQFVDKMAQPLDYPILCETMLATGLPEPCFMLFFSTRFTRFYATVVPLPPCEA